MQNITNPNRNKRFLSNLRSRITWRWIIWFLLANKEAFLALKYYSNLYQLFLSRVTLLSCLLFMFFSMLPLLHHLFSLGNQPLLSRGWHFSILHVPSTISQILKHIQEGGFFFSKCYLTEAGDWQPQHYLPSALSNPTTTIHPSCKRFWCFNSEFRDPFPSVVPFYYFHSGRDMWNSPWRLFSNSSQPGKNRLPGSDVTMSTLLYLLTKNSTYSH